VNGVSLCSGIGGIDLGLRLALGESYRTVCFVERDAFAASVLVARMEDKALDLAPIWDDLYSFDGKPWRGVVDIVSAGFPCQPWSVAGKRKGIADERWLWPEIARIIGECEPSFVFLENVPGLLWHGLSVVLEDLAALGFDVEWDSFRASDVGAPHKRERLFILAHARRADWWSRTSALASRNQTTNQAKARCGGVGDTEYSGLERSRQAWSSVSFPSRTKRP
jgi:DNA (cytosine-5)-methyltransferase 1